MKAIFLLLFIPAVAFAQGDSVPMPTRDEVLKIAESYQAAHGFKKSLIFSQTYITLQNMTKIEGVFLGITPQSLVILRNGKEEIIMRDSIDNFTFREMVPNPEKNGFSSGYVMGMYAGFVVANRDYYGSSPYYLHNDGSLIGSVAAGLLAGAVFGYAGDLINGNPATYFYVGSTKNEEKWNDALNSLKENPDREKTVHLSVTSSYVYSRMKNELQVFKISSKGDYSYSSAGRDHFPVNLLRRVSISISPSFLQNFEIGIAYSNLDELYLSDRGHIRYRDTSYSVFFNMQSQSEGLYGIVSYPVQILKDTYLKLGAGAGRALVNFRETLRGDYYYYGPNFPEIVFSQNGKFLSALGFFEVSHNVTNTLSFGLMGDYIWINAPQISGNPDIYVPARKIPFNTFSIGFTTGFNF